MVNIHIYIYYVQLKQSLRLTEHHTMVKFHAFLTLALNGVSLPVSHPTSVRQEGLPAPKKSGPSVYVERKMYASARN
jgi:hypothetical protein